MSLSLLDRIVEQFDSTYIISGDEVKKVQRKKDNKFSEEIYICKDNTCTCQAGMHGVVCRHQKMKLQTFAATRKVSAKVAKKVTLLAESVTLGHPVRSSCAFKGVSCIQYKRKRTSEDEYDLICAVKHALPVYWVLT